MTPEGIAGWILVISGAFVTAVLLWLTKVQPIIDRRREKRLQKEREEREKYLAAEQDARSREAARKRQEAEYESAEKQMTIKQFSKQQQALFKIMSDQLEDLWGKFHAQNGKLLQTEMEYTRCQGMLKAEQDKNLQQEKTITDLKLRICELEAQVEGEQ